MEIVVLSLSEMIPANFSVLYPDVVITPEGKQGGEFTQVRSLSVEIKPYSCSVYIVIGVNGVHV